ncbi:MAG: methyltransferase domain-containing protein [Candidatus Shapirobacteria bacterium]|jgi:ubiquinone/menaquinone biosynthesis C-methylase UbiE
MKSNNLAEHESRNNQFFGKWAWLYDYEKYLLSPMRKKAVNFLDLPPNQKILDVATGTGAQAYEFAKLGHEVLGIDLSEEMLLQARKKCTPNLQLNFQHIDATKMPFGSNSFDTSSISWGLHDMPYEVEMLVLQEMKRVTKKSGQILIVDYMEPKNHLIAKFFHPLACIYETQNYKPYINRGLDSILDKVGLNISKSTNFLGFVQISLVVNS